MAVQLDEKASSLTNGTNGAVLGTLARAKFIAGDKEGAINTQEAAIQHAPKEEMKPEIEEALASYKENKLPPAKGK